MLGWNRLEEEHKKTGKTYAELLREDTGRYRGGRPRIQDEFTDENLTKDQKYSLRRQRDGRCMKCGGPRPCTRHNAKARAYRAKRKAQFKAWIAAGRPKKRDLGVLVSQSQRFVTRAARGV